MTSLHDLTALEQAAAIRAGETSSVELTEHYLARTEAYNDAVGAFITVTPEMPSSRRALLTRRCVMLPTLMNCRSCTAWSCQ